MPSTHTYGCISNLFVGITLLVSMQGCGKPQIADEQKVDTHVFRCVVQTIIVEPKLGYHEALEKL